MQTIPYCYMNKIKNKCFRLNQARARSSKTVTEKKTKKTNKKWRGRGDTLWFKQDGWRQNVSLCLWQCVTEFLHETTLSSLALLTMNLKDSLTPENKFDTALYCTEQSGLSLNSTYLIPLQFLGTICYEKFLDLFVVFGQICQFIYFS